MKSIKIENKKIGKNHPCFIIAEAGVNHNGKIKWAKKLIDKAADAGADAVKFQTYKTKGLTTNYVNIPKYARKNINKEIKQVKMMKKLELSYNEFKILKEYCIGKNIIFLSTPHSFDAIDFLDEIVPAFKFGSGDLTNLPALKYAAKKGKPLIIGTGMATLNEVKEAEEAIKKTGNNQIIILHCTTNYPCPVAEVNMNAMITLQKELSCLVGYSDHTLGITVPIMAASLGAAVIEKHFTLNKNLKGPDHKASLEPNELKKMVEEIRNVENAFGKYEKKPTNSEKKIMKYVRKSIVAKKEIQKGEIIKINKIEIKRPGTGLSPKILNKIVGKKAKKHIKKNELISLKDIID